MDTTVTESFFRSAVDNPCHTPNAAGVVGRLRVGIDEVLEAAMEVGFRTYRLAGGTWIRLQGGRSGR